MTRPPTVRSPEYRSLISRSGGLSSGRSGREASGAGRRWLPHTNIGSRSGRGSPRVREAAGAAIRDALAALLDLLPDFVLKGAGVDMDAIRRTAEVFSVPAGPAAETIPSLIGPETRLAVGGEVRLYFEGAPRDLRVGRVRSDNPDVPIDVTLGYAMAGA